MDEDEKMEEMQKSAELGVKSGQDSERERKSAELRAVLLRVYWGALHSQYKRAREREIWRH